VSTDLVSLTSTPVMAQRVVREVVEVLEASAATLFLVNDGELEPYCSWPAHFLPLARTFEQAGRTLAAAEREDKEADLRAGDQTGLIHFILMDYTDTPPWACITCGGSADLAGCLRSCTLLPGYDRGARPLS